MPGNVITLASSISNLSETLTCFARASLATCLAFASLDSLDNKYTKITVKNEQKKNEQKLTVTKTVVARPVVYHAIFLFLYFKGRFSRKCSHASDVGRVVRSRLTLTQD